MPKVKDSDLTLDCLKSYEKKAVAEKGFKEGKKLINTYG